MFGADAPDVLEVERVKLERLLLRRFQPLRQLHTGTKTQAHRHTGKVTRLRQTRTQTTRPNDRPADRPRQTDRQTDTQRGR